MTHFSHEIIINQPRESENKSLQESENESKAPHKFPIIGFRR